MFKKVLSLGNAIKASATKKKDSTTDQNSKNPQVSATTTSSVKAHSHSQKQPSLPANFADEVFNLELEIETSELDIAHVTRLLELYSIAIEYYEAIKSDKYLIFKNKTKNLLLKQNVNLAMDRATEELKTEPNCNTHGNISLNLMTSSSSGISSSGNPSNFNNSKNNQVIDLLELDLDIVKDKKEVISTEEFEIKQKRQKELELNVKYIQQSDTKESVKNLLDTHCQDIRQNMQIIQHDTDKQKNLLLQRLKMRKDKKQAGTESINGNSAVQTQSSSSSTNNQKPKEVNLLDMDIEDITTSNTTSNSSSQVTQQITDSNIESNSDYFNDYLQIGKSDTTTYSSGSAFSTQTSNNSNSSSTTTQSNYSDIFANVTHQYGYSGLQEQKKPSSSSVKEGVEAECTKNEQVEKPKPKKKVRVSQKSVMEHQMQNSTIPF